jgi:hypothetical protein
MEQMVLTAECYLFCHNVRLHFKKKYGFSRVYNLEKSFPDISKHMNPVFLTGLNLDMCLFHYLFRYAV